MELSTVACSCVGKRQSASHWESGSSVRGRWMAFLKCAILVSNGHEFERNAIQGGNGHARALVLCTSDLMVSLGLSFCWLAARRDVGSWLWSSWMDFSRRAILLSNEHWMSMTRKSGCIRRRLFEINFLSLCLPGFPLAGDL
jgi:hypothetical protein